MNTRRRFLITAPLGAAAAVIACRSEPQTATVTPLPATPGAPPTFGSGPVSGPAVSPSTFAEAERLAQVTMSAAEREMAAASWPRSMAPLLERRVGPRKIALDPTVAPATRWNPALAGEAAGPARDAFVRTSGAAVPLPASDADIAYAPVAQLSRWIEQRTLTSERLTAIYLQRIEQFDPKLRCVITLTKEFALLQARKADAEIAGGKYRGPLHGIPYGVKDLLDTAGIATTYGAEPFRNRVPAADSAVVRRLNDAGAVLIASREKAEELGLKPRARFVSFSLAGDSPILMLTAPIPATRRVLDRAGLTLEDIDVVEINEAFASVVLAWAKEVGADLDKTNPNGGAIALGHPLGGTGAFLMTKALYELERTGGRYALISMCCGGGLGTGTIIERI